MLAQARLDSSSDLARNTSFRVASPQWPTTTFITAEDRMHSIVHGVDDEQLAIDTAPHGDAFAS